MEGDDIGGESLNGNGDDITPVEYRRMLNRALREGDRRLQEGKLGDTALSRYMAQAVTFLEEERRRDEANRPNPVANVAQAGDFISELRRIRANDGMTTARMREILKTYLVLCEEHLELARAFDREIAVDA